MTQSGVSQHIKRLEEELDTKLFIRLPNKIVLSESGILLRSHLEKVVEAQDVLQEGLAKKQSSLRGKVCYAMPESCLSSPHFPSLLKTRREYFGDIQLQVSLHPPDRILRLLLDGEIHFGFMTQRVDDPLVEYLPFCFEEYVLVGGTPAIAHIHPDALVDNAFIKHPGVAMLFEIWWRATFPEKTFHFGQLSISGECSHLAAAKIMVEQRAGLTVLAKHCVSRELAEGSLYCYEQDQPVHNQIYLITLKDAYIPRRVQVVMDTFFRMTKVAD